MAQNPVSIPRLAIIGGSAGSIEVLISILPHLPRETEDTAVVIVLHRPAESDGDMARMLGAHSAWPVSEAEDKTVLKGGQVYIAPPDYHLLVERNGQLSLDFSEKVHFCRPAIDVTMESAAIALEGGVSALLLSGANRDGATGLQSVLAAGGLAAVQAPETAATPFMPQSALKLDANLPRLAEEGMIGFLMRER